MPYTEAAAPGYHRQTWNNLTCTASLSLTGYSCFNSDTTGTELKQDLTVTGQIGTSGAQLTLDQRRFFHSIQGSGPHAFASTAQDWINNRLTFGADIYQWNNVHKERSLEKYQWFFRLTARYVYR